MGISALAICVLVPVAASAQAADKVVVTRGESRTDLTGQVLEIETRAGEVIMLRRE